MSAFVSAIVVVAPISFERSVWYADIGGTVLAVVAALTVYGIWSSVAGRSAAGVSEAVRS